MAYYQNIKGGGKKNNIFSILVIKIEKIKNFFSKFACNKSTQFKYYEKISYYILYFLCRDYDRTGAEWGF